MSSSTGAGSYSDFAETTSFGSDDEDETETTSSEDSDLQELYESFEFEDGTSRVEGCSSTPERAVAGALLYPGADLSSLQSNLLLFQFAVRHSLTAKALTELLQLLAVHLPRGAVIPKSVHSLKQFFVDSFPESQAIQHSYCSCCQRPLASTSASCHGSGCSGGTPGVFITIPVGPQLKRMMEGIIHVHIQRMLVHFPCICIYHVYVLYHYTSQLTYMI